MLPERFRDETGGAMAVAYLVARLVNPAYAYTGRHRRRGELSTSQDIALQVRVRQPSLPRRVPFASFDVYGVPPVAVCGWEAAT